MTTIRVTRRPRTPAVDADGPDMRSSLEPPRRADDGAVRLALIDPPAPRTTLDGAWWPRTSTLTDELPALVEELRRRGIRVTRAAYNPDSWAPTSRRLQADGRTIRLGWFRHIDPQLLNLTGDLTRGRLDLLVVPPLSTATDAQRAFSAATDPANQAEPTALLDGLSAAGPPVAPPRSAPRQRDLQQTGVRDAEGSHR
jgi:Family of unknown function (DUF5994)